MNKITDTSALLLLACDEGFVPIEHRLRANNCGTIPPTPRRRLFRQLTAERVVTRFEWGRPIRSWKPKRDGERNEALDTFVYAHAALHGLISMGLRLNEERWSGLRRYPSRSQQLSQR